MKENSISIYSLNYSEHTNLNYSVMVVTNCGSLGSSNLSIVCVWNIVNKAMIRIGSSTDSVSTPIQVVAVKYGSQSYAILKPLLVPLRNSSALRNKKKKVKFQLQGYANAIYSTSHHFYCYTIKP